MFTRYQADLTVARKQVIEQQTRRCGALQIHERKIVPAGRTPDAHDLGPAGRKEIQHRVVSFRLHDDGAVHLKRVEAVAGPEWRNEAKGNTLAKAVTAAAAAISMRKPSLDGPAATAKGIDETSAIDPALPVRNRCAR